MRINHHLLLPPLIGIALLAMLLTTSSQPVHAHLGVNDEPTNAHQNVVTVTLAITIATPVANQAVNISATLTNHAISETVGNPIYTLWLESENETPILVPEEPQVQYGASIAPGASGTAIFDLYPVAGGQITVTVQVTISRQLSPVDNTKIGWRADPISLAIPTPSQEAAIIYESAPHNSCFEFQIAAGDGWGAYDCVSGPGHSFGTHLARADSPAAAMAAFNAARGELELEEFHCHSAYSWSDRPYGGPITYSGHGWTTARWVNISHAEDDTPFGGAWGASESIYYTMKMRNLIEPCTQTYLPINGR